MPGIQKVASSRLSAHPAAVAFLFAFLASLAVALIQGPKYFFFDSGEYWFLSSTFTHGGHFSLLNFENTGLRGYALPLLYHSLRAGGSWFTSDEPLMVVLFNSALLALIGTVLAPRLARIAWPQIHWSVPRRLSLAGLILIFWSGYLNYPLSDFPALAAAMLAIIAISAFDSPLAMLGAGAAAMAALNMRPAYILLMPLLLILVAWGWRGQSEKPHPPLRWRALCVACFALGALFVSLPQSLSQHDAYGSYNPIPGAGGLAGLQYTEGLRLQRYETFVAGTPEQARMEYRDGDTAGIVADLPQGAVSNTAEYAEIVIEHPVTMAGVFLRHIVNGLDQRYTTPYVEHLEPPSRRLLRLAGFLLVFLALVRILWPPARRTFGPARWRYPAVLLLACATSIPSAIETRFLLPAFVLSAMVVVAPGWIRPTDPGALGLRRYRPLALMTLAAVLFFGLVWMVVAGASDSLHLG